jgi:hypothetical protein
LDIRLMKRWILLLAVAWQAVGCTQDKNPPPIDYSPDWAGGDDPVTCDVLREANPLVDPSARFTIDGGQAGCAIDGLQCPVGVCDAGGSGMAECFAGYWVMSCAAARDGGKDVNAADAAVEPDAHGSDGGGE